MAQGLQIKRAYGFNAYVDVFPLPIVTNRAPVNGQDTGLNGQTWVNTAASVVYMMANQANSTWVATSAGTGTFANLTITPGPTSLTGALTTVSGALATNIATDPSTGVVNIGITGTRTVTIGSPGATSSVVIQGGTNGVQVGANAIAQPVTIGSVAGASVTTIQGGNGATALNLTVTAGGTMNISNSATASTVNIGNGAAPKTVVVGSTNPGSTLNVFTPTAGVGTGLRINNGTAVAAIYVGTNVPAFVAVQGSLFIRTDATTTTSRLYVYTDGGAWATFTTSS